MDTKRKNKQIKLIAFYLPQFHAIPENDRWWGKGFTEWTNVKRGKPYYRGHYQPREPLADNYYNLDDDRVLKDHIQLAKKAGLYGFCFYHYYFTGRKLLEKPIERFLQDKSMDFPFCLAWANQSFCRTWYGKEQQGEMLLRQTYGGLKEWEEHFMYLFPFFTDERYIKIDGKPIYLIYLPSDFKKINSMIRCWKSLAAEKGLSGIYFIFMDTAYQTSACKGMDAYVEFEPLRTLRDLSMREQKVRKIKKTVLSYIGLTKWGMANKFLLDRQYDYDRIYSMIGNRKRTPDAKTFLGAFPGWDNTARKDLSGFIVEGSTPAKFEKYLKQQIIRSKEFGNDYLFINAWNEWSEGAYLEADKRYGYSYLRALKRALGE